MYCWHGGFAAVPAIQRTPRSQQGSGGQGGEGFASPNRWRATKMWRASATKEHQ